LRANLRAARGSTRARLGDPAHNPMARSEYKRDRTPSESIHFSHDEDQWMAA